MSARSFLDTNVLVYTDDHDTPDKQRVALDLVERFRLQRTGVVSTQVLQEYFAAATRKLKVRPDLARRKHERHWMASLRINSVEGFFAASEGQFYDFDY